MTKKGNGKVGEQVPPAPPQNQVQVGPQQIQAAAAAGAELLADKDLRVPLGSAAQLSLLQGLLGAVAQGQLVLVSADEAEKLKADPAPGLPTPPADPPANPAKGPK